MSADTPAPILSIGAATRLRAVFELHAVRVQQEACAYPGEVEWCHRYVDLLGEYIRDVSGKLAPQPRLVPFPGPGGKGGGDAA